MGFQNPCVMDFTRWPSNILVIHHVLEMFSGTHELVSELIQLRFDRITQGIWPQDGVLNMFRNGNSAVDVESQEKRYQHGKYNISNLNKFTVLL